MREVRLPSAAGHAASQARSQLAVLVDEQTSWPSSSAALAAWPKAVEAYGILVFSLPLGEASCRGFSIWDSYSPLIALNSCWNPEARIFTLFHEYGHLLTRTNSACLNAGISSLPLDGDPIERWCEEFAAALLLPWNAVIQVLSREVGWVSGAKVTKLAGVAQVARRFRVSLRATALTLIKHGAADWSIYGALPKASDNKPTGGGKGPDSNSLCRPAS